MSQQQLDAFIAAVRSDPEWLGRLRQLEAGRDVERLAGDLRQAGYDLEDAEIVWLLTCRDWMSDEPPVLGQGAMPLGVWG